MFNKFFGKKNDGFFMQIDESAPPKADSAPKEVATKSKADAPKSDVAKESAPSAEVIPATVVAAIPEAATESKNKSAKTSIKKDKKDKKEDKKQDKAAEVPPVAAAAPAFTNFATDYLVTPAVAGNRRRPGANMKGFMSMARDVKDMKKGSVGNQLKEKAAKKTEA
jgi:hypothetical protein